MSDVLSFFGGWELLSARARARARRKGRRLEGGFSDITREGPFKAALLIPAKEPISLAFAEPRHVNVEIVDTNQILQFYYYTKYTVVVRLVRLD